jgi:hypothetical protein
VVICEVIEGWTGASGRKAGLARRGVGKGFETGSKRVGSMAPSKASG